MPFLQSGYADRAVCEFPSRDTGVVHLDTLGKRITLGRTTLVSVPSLCGQATRNGKW